MDRFRWISTPTAGEAFTGVVLAKHVYEEGITECEILGTELTVMVHLMLQTGHRYTPPQARCGYRHFTLPTHSGLLHDLSLLGLPSLKMSATAAQTGASTRHPRLHPWPGDW